MQRIQPQGKLLIVEPLKSETTTTEGGIQVSEKTSRGKVLEVCEQYKDIYKKGDVILFAEGAGHGLQYMGKACLYINGGGYPSDGDVWGILIEDKKAKK